jgi:CheY-like chemotaxis protein
MVDMIDSTKVVAGIAIPYKIRKYYSIFLNSMSLMIKKYGAIINKNVGDSLIYYFPETSDSTNKSAFKDVIECGITMMAAFRVINFKMSQMNLPRVDYKISADYGKNIVAKSKVDTFTDSQEALKHFAQSDPYHYKLILLDIRMPNLNGIQLYYRLKAINPNVRIIFVTALDVITLEFYHRKSE